MQKVYFQVITYSVLYFRVQVMVANLRPRGVRAQPNQAEVEQEEELKEDEIPVIRQIRVNVGRGGRG